MKRKFDFLVDRHKGISKTILRFYPKHSDVHGFNDTPPTNWNDVYKTYMTFSILRYWENDNIEGKYEKPHELFSYSRDEGEGLLELREVLREMITSDCKDEYELIPFGDGIDWEIYRYKRNKELFVFNMINDFSGECYRFILNMSEIADFFRVLDNFLEYMLKHSVGI